jgi:hypothetical protein
MSLELLFGQNHISHKERSEGAHDLHGLNHDHVALVVLVDLENNRTFLLDVAGIFCTAPNISNISSKELRVLLNSQVLK